MNKPNTVAEAMLNFLRAAARANEDDILQIQYETKGWMTCSDEAAMLEEAASLAFELAEAVASEMEEEGEDDDEEPFSVDEIVIETISNKGRFGIDSDGFLYFWNPTRKDWVLEADEYDDHTDGKDFVPDSEAVFLRQALDDKIAEANNMDDTVVQMLKN